MPTNLKGRSILTLDDLTAAEIRFLLRLAAELKSAKFSGSERQRLKGKNIALIFEKDSTRTRTGFEVAAYDQGAHVTYLDPSGSQIGHKESMKDTARVLGRMYDAIEFRGYSQRSARELAQFAGVPVYNGLTDEAHPARTHPSRKSSPGSCSCWRGVRPRWLLWRWPTRWPASPGRCWQEARSTERRRLW